MENHKKLGRAIGKAVAFLLAFALLILFATTSKLQRRTKTTKEQAEQIEQILIDNRIEYQTVRWSYSNIYLSNQGIFEYYEIKDREGKEYGLALRVPVKQVYAIYNKTDGIQVYLDESLYPSRPDNVKRMSIIKRAGHCPALLFAI